MLIIKLQLVNIMQQFLFVCMKFKVSQCKQTCILGNVPNTIVTIELALIRIACMHSDTCREQPVVKLPLPVATCYPVVYTSHTLGYCGKQLSYDLYFTHACQVAYSYQVHSLLSYYVEQQSIVIVYELILLSYQQHVHSCTPLYAHVHSYTLMYTHLHPCTHSCTPMYTHACSGTPMYTHSYALYTNTQPCTCITHVHSCMLRYPPCTPICAVHQCTAMYTHVYSCTLVYTDIQSCIPMYICVYPCDCDSVDMHSCHTY